MREAPSQEQSRIGKSHGRVLIQCGVCLWSVGHERVPPVLTHQVVHLSNRIGFDRTPREFSEIVVQRLLVALSADRKGETETQHSGTDERVASASALRSHSLLAPTCRKATHRAPFAPYDSCRTCSDPSLPSLPASKELLSAPASSTARRLNEPSR